MSNIDEKNKMTAALLLLLFTCFSQSVSANFEEFPELRMHGIAYPNSCNIEQKNILQKSVIESGAQDRQQAWKAIDLILCASDEIVGRQSILSLFRKKVRQTSESTGDNPVTKNVIVTEKIISRVMAKGNAWNTDIIAEKRKIVLQYFVNEACVNSITLFYKDSKWSVYEIGQACD